MLSSRDAYENRDELVVVVYEHTEGNGNTVWTARNDRNAASTPSSTRNSKKSALASLLQKVGVSRTDVDKIEVVDDVAGYEKIMMQRCDKELEQPAKEGWFLGETENEAESVEFGSVGEAALLQLDEAYRLKEKYPQYNFDFQRGQQ